MNNNFKEIKLADIKKYFTPRKKDTNKGTYGTVGILGGSLSYSGAIKLSTLSYTALKSGCGLARVIVPQEIVTPISNFLLEQTIYPLKNYTKKEIINSTKDLKALAIGMGLGTKENNQILLTTILNNYTEKLIIDADGLNTLAKLDLQILTKTKASLTLTPHLKEFSRLTNLTIEEIKKNKLEIAKNFAQKYHIILVLKDYETIVTDGYTSYLIKKGTPGMATAGSGDVLTGIILGMLAYNEYSPLTVSAATFLAGLAGELAANNYTDISLTARNTIEYIPNAIKYIRERS